LLTKKFSKRYLLYLIAGTLIAAGFADFALIAFHFQKTAIVAQSMIPVFYAAAMGLLYDKSILVLALFSVVLQMAALPVLFFAGCLEKE
jgi:hypothetical protein